MKYYKPWWAAVLSMLSSMIGSLTFPFFGWIFSEFLFIIMAPQLPTYAEKRDEWSLYFLAMCLGMGFVGFSQKILFAESGENLTFDIRS
jgi:hypothetical protein